MSKLDANTIEKAIIFKRFVDILSLIGEGRAMDINNEEALLDFFHDVSDRN